MDEIIDFPKSGAKLFEFVVKVDSLHGGINEKEEIADIMLDKVEATKLYERLGKFLFE
jgi:hypothetical protein